MKDVVHVRVEKSEANHLYNPQVDAIWSEMYGHEFLISVKEEATDIVREERDRLREAYFALWDAAASSINNDDVDILKDAMRKLARRVQGVV